MSLWGFLFLFTYFSGLISFCVKRKHLLLMLMSLEFVVLSLFSFMIYFLTFYGLESYFSMIFVSMCVSEGALGLSVLVLMVRTHGSDRLGVFSVLW